MSGTLEGTHHFYSTRLYKQGGKWFANYRVGSTRTTQMLKPAIPLLESGRVHLTLIFDDVESLEAFQDDTADELADMQDYIHLVRGFEHQMLVLTIEEMVTRIQRVYPLFEPALSDGFDSMLSANLGMKEEFVSPLQLEHNANAASWSIQSVTHDELHRFAFIEMLTMIDTLAAGRQSSCPGGVPVVATLQPHGAWSLQGVDSDEEDLYATLAFLDGGVWLVVDGAVDRSGFRAIDAFEDEILTERQVIDGLLVTGAPRKKPVVADPSRWISMVKRIAPLDVLSASWEVF